MASRLPVGRQSAETRFGLACSLGHAYSVPIITHWVLRAPKKDTAHVIRSVMFVAVDNSQSTLYDSLTGPLPLVSSLWLVAKRALRSATLISRKLLNRLSSH